MEEYTARFGGTPGMDISVSPTSSGSSMGSMMSGNSKDIKLVGDDLDALREAADLVEEAMTQVPGVISAENDFAQSRVKGRVVDSQKALAAGTTEAGVATQISYLLGGVTAATLENGDTEYDVVEYPEGKYESITDLLEYPITTRSGQIITLGDIAEVEYVTTLPSISREDGRYTATITATTTSTGKSSASVQIDAAVRELNFPEGVSTAMTMLGENTGEQTSSLGPAIAAAIFLAFLVMAIQFESPPALPHGHDVHSPEPHRLHRPAVHLRPGHEHDEGHVLYRGGRPDRLHRPGHVPDAGLLSADPRRESGRRQETRTVPAAPRQTGRRSG